ncbi:unnamed protein product [Allacma fusca]|uniref:Uncharacterized protein n=1 Tax=Allacma fusca TaxID=39272 RepID=A0A8J2PB65_9HEXA|nr:unnamed protein product [Allacma fusca]
MPLLTRSPIIRGDPSLLIAQDTALGWIIFGPTPAEVTLKLVTHLVTANTDEILRKFWEIEDISTSRSLTTEEKECNAHYVATTVRREDGTYQVRLPFKKGCHPLGDSKSVALKRFYQMERRLSRNSDLKRQYCAFMEEYIHLGHLQMIDLTDEPPVTNDRKYCLPHHCFMKEASTTTKLRVVFDASAKSTSGVSRNDQLMIGPVIQEELFAILTRWRIHVVPICADIKQMYRHIWMHPEDCNYQRVLWRESPSLPLKENRALTVTYGEASAPFQAVRTLHQLAQDYEVRYPAAATVLRRDVYMDDCITGESTPAQAIALQKELMHLMEEARFTLRKWSSSLSAVLETLPEELRETQLPFQFNENDSIKALGLYWNPATDEFKFTVQPMSDQTVTKRSTISQIARVFDPLGLISPVTVRGKLLMQEL